MMAKTKNSKILAMALCASVMAGIYASPVLAGEVTNITGNNSGLNIQIDKKMMGGANGLYFLRGDNDGGAVYGNLVIGGDKIAGALINQTLNLDALTTANLTIGSESINATNIAKWNAAAKANENVAGIERLQNGAGNNITEIENTLRIYDNGTISTVNGAFRVNPQGAVFAESINIGDGAFTVNNNGGVSVAQGINAAGGKFNISADGTLSMNQGEGNIFAVNDNGDITASGTFNALSGDYRVSNINGETTMQLGAANLTETQLANINNVVQENGNVVANSLNVANGAFEVTNDGTVNGPGKFTIYNNGVMYAPDGGTIGGVIFNNDGSVAGTRFSIAKTGEITAINFKAGSYNLLEVGDDLTALQGTVDGTTADITALEQKTAGISKTGPITTVGGVAFAQGHMDADYVLTDGLKVNGISDLDGVQVHNGSIYAENDSYIGGVQLADGLVDGVNMENLKGIERIDYGNGVNVTKIEGVTEFDNTGMGVYTDTGASVIGGGRATFNDGESTTSIIGGAITAETLNDKVIDDLVEGSDIADDLANVSGITRTDENNDGKLDTTTIEGSTSFDANGMNVGNGAVAANADGSFRAANGQFDVASDGTLTISNANDPLGDKTQIGAGYINLGDTSINGFGIETPYIEATTGEIGGVTIDGGLVDGVDVSEIGEAVGENGKLGGITREDRLTNITGLDTTVIEDSFSVNKENINMFGDNGLDFTYGTMPNGEGGVNVAGNLNFMSGADVTFKYSDSKSYSLNDLVKGISDLNDRVDVLEDKTQNINSDATHGGNGQTGQGGEVIDNGANTGFDGDVTVGGDVTAVDGNFSGKVTVGGETGTSITGDGITVGDKNGVSIKNDEVRVGGGEDGKGGSYMNENDVVTGEGNSLNDTANRVGNLEQGVSELNNRVGELEDRIDKVGAMAAAIANLRTMGYDPAAPTEVAVGIGQYRDETGAALGLFHYPNRDFMLSLSVSTSGDEVMGGIGATWKFGRKSPEKVAEIKKAQAEADARRAEEAKLAKAEEMKQAAKEAKIKAQQERHAKLAAERAAQAEAAK